MHIRYTYKKLFLFKIEVVSAAKSTKLAKVDLKDNIQIEMLQYSLQNILLAYVSGDQEVQHR